MQLVLLLMSMSSYGRTFPPLKKKPKLNNITIAFPTSLCPPPSGDATGRMRAGLPHLCLYDERAADTEVEK
jgi:hypothetical protein